MPGRHDLSDLFTRVYLAMLIPVALLAIFTPLGWIILVPWTMAYAISWGIVRLAEWLDR